MTYEKMTQIVDRSGPGAFAHMAAPSATWRIALVEGLRSAQEAQLELLETLPELLPAVVSEDAKQMFQELRAVLDEHVHRLELVFARNGAHVRRRLDQHGGPFQASVLNLLANTASSFARDVVLLTALGGALSRLMMHEDELLDAAQMCREHEVAHMLRMALAEQRDIRARLRGLGSLGQIG